MPPNNLPDDLKYWMGVVDTRLTTLQSLIEGLVNTNKDNWAEFHAWRKGVDERLAIGSTRFEAHEKRLTEVEEDIRILQCNQMARIEKNGEAKGKDDEDEKFITWSWVRDKLLMPILIPLLITVLTVSIVVSYLMSRGIFDNLP